jgi:hypothetical protein
MFMLRKSKIVQNLRIYWFINTLNRKYSKIILTAISPDAKPENNLKELPKTGIKNSRREFK